MTMDLSDLRMFRTIIEAGSLTRAAEQLHTVQSNVTTRLRQLEEDLGTPLFDRINRRLVITPAGTLLAGYAEKLLSLADEARDAVRRADQPEGLLRLGAMETTAAARLPGVIAAFRRAHPRVELRLRTAPTPTLVQEVLAHQLDAALVSGPVVHPELECQPVVVEEVVLISAADWATIDNAADLARRGPVELFTFREGLQLPATPLRLAAPGRHSDCPQQRVRHLRSDSRLCGRRHGRQSGAEDGHRRPPERGRPGQGYPARAPRTTRSGLLNHGDDLASGPQPPTRPTGLRRLPCRTTRRPHGAQTQ
jgi:DNA-binding transcriptional LysR family regulator